MKWNTNPVKRKRDSTCSKKIRFRARANTYIHTHTHTGYNETKTRFPSSSSSVHGISYQGLKLTNPILSRWLWWWIKQDSNAKEIIPTRFLSPLSLSLSFSFHISPLRLSFSPRFLHFSTFELSDRWKQGRAFSFVASLLIKEEQRQRGNRRERRGGRRRSLGIMDLTGLQVASLWTL